MNIFKLHLINDIDSQNTETLLEIIKSNTRFSISYISLVVASTIISTLGLLINSPATIIGGMIIAPLMWPLIKISMGISLSRKSYIIQALFLLLVSLMIIITTAALITFISPLKGINSEILSRSQPTLLDLFIALAAGTIATLALIRKRISASLAGVAIATSLLPPLCVTGIGIALSNFSITFGSFLLFTANAISIIFISIFMFRFEGITSHKDEKFKNDSILFVAIMLAITALPLFVFLLEYSFKATAYQTSQRVLQNIMQDISPDIVVDTVKTDIAKEKGTIVISSDILVPEGTTLSLEQKEDIINKLEESLQRKVQLNLRVQQTIALKSTSDKQAEYQEDILRKETISSIQQLDQAISIDTISIHKAKDSDTWNVMTVMRADPSIKFTETQRLEVQNLLSQKIKKTVVLSIEIIPRIELTAEKDEVNIRIKEDISIFLKDISKEITLNSVTILNSNEKKEIQIEMYTPQSITVTNNQLQNLKNKLESEYKVPITILLNDIKTRTVSL